MKVPVMVLVGAACLAHAETIDVPCGQTRNVVPSADAVMFRPIFNGRDLSGWNQKDGFFSVRDGAIVGESTAEHPCEPNHHLVYTAEELADFELRAEFRLSKASNSGIQLRCAPQFVSDNGYQADMNGGGNFVGFLHHSRQFLVGERGTATTLAGVSTNKSCVRLAEREDISHIALASPSDIAKRSAPPAP